MFYSHSILARKSPLGTVWIAAHLERKVKKTQVDGIDIPSYAECIMFPEVPIALRLSGHLLLGLVRIYSWKVNYLFQDCNRMLTTIRTAFASVQVDLPVDADRAPFDAITMPDTFKLDDLNLDDAIRQMDTPDNHRKTPDQITLSEEYVTITLDDTVTLDEYGRVEPSPHGRFSYLGPEPTEDGILPPFPSNDISVDPPHNSSPANNTNIEQDPPEILRRATESPQKNNDVIDGNDPVDHDPSPFKDKVMTPPEMGSYLSPGGGSSPWTSIPNVRRSPRHDPIEDEESRDIGIPVPRFSLEPSPPQVQGNKRKRMPEVQENRRKRKPKFDDEIVLSNVYMKKQIDGDELCKLVCKRRKLPHTSVDMWKYKRTCQKDNFWREPLVHEMCTNLHETYERKLPHVSDPETESASDKHATSAANVGDWDASPERQLTPKSQGNADAQPEDPRTLKSPGAADAQPEHPLNPESPDMLPELPRFSPHNTLSPARELSPIREPDDTPFKTPGRTPQSGHRGTGATEIPPTQGSYVSPGEKTFDSDPNASPFPFDDEPDDDIPEIPGLLNTPSMISSAGTGATGLGSMSTRTRAVAQYFKDQMSSATSPDEPGKFSLNRILEGRTRKQAARMFFETLALKSYDYIDIQQEEAYSDIAVTVKPSLTAAKL